MKQFDGKVALVTGGNMGLGRATAEAFAREGARVVMVGRREELGQKVAASIRASGGDASFLRCDVSSEEQVKALIEQIQKTYGRLDCAYNNAAELDTKKFALLADIATEAFDSQMATSLRGVFLCMKYEIRAMIEGGGGSIVNCSTVVTLRGMPTCGAYTAAKAGVEALTRTAAHEYAGKNIRVNTVSPGSFDTPTETGAQKFPQEVVDAMIARISLHRLGRPPELAPAVLFLCSDSASFINGSNLVVDGGYLLT